MENFVHNSQWGGNNSANLTLPRVCINPEVACQGVGENWAGPFFLHPDNVKHQPCSEGYLVRKNFVHMANGVENNSANLTLSKIRIQPKVAC